MNSRKRIIIVAKKEIIEFVRDWRTIVALVLIPLLLFPLLFIAFPIVMQNEAAELNEKTVHVLIQSDEIETSLVLEIENQSALTTTEAMPANLLTLSHSGNDTERLRNLDYDAILRMEQRNDTCLLYTSPSPRDAHESRMPSSA